MSSVNLLKCRECGSAKVWMVAGQDMTTAVLMGVTKASAALMCMHCDWAAECCADWLMGSAEPMKVDFRYKCIVGIGWEQKKPFGLLGPRAKLPMIRPGDADMYWPGAKPLVDPPTNQE